jgi:hypothetical protein
MSAIQLYALCATMYGSARASFRSSEMDVLPGTKLVNVVVGGIYAPFLLPVYVINDINRGYICKNDLKYSDYGYPEKDTCLADILFK